MSRSRTLPLAAAALVAAVAGLWLDVSPTVAEILALAVVGASGLALHSGRRASLLDALCLTAISCATAAVIVGGALRSEAVAFGLGATMPAAALEISIAVFAPIAAAMGLMAFHPPFARDSSASTLPGSLVVVALFFVVAALSAAAACVLHGARFADYGLVVHHIQERGIGLPRALLGTAVAGAIAWGGIRVNRRRADARDWALPLTIAVMVAVYAI